MAPQETTVQPLAAVEETVDAPETADGAWLARRNGSPFRAFNQRGPWWNSGAQHMNYAFPKKYFDSMGLVSMIDRLCLSR